MLRSIAAKLGASFALVVALLIAVALGGYVAVDRARTVNRELVEGTLPLLGQIEAAEVAHLNVAVQVRDLVSNGDLSAQARTRTALKESRERLAAASGALRASLPAIDPAGMPVLARLQEDNQRAEAALAKALEHVDRAQYDEATMVVYDQLRPLQAAMGEHLASIRGRVLQLSAQSAQEAAAGASRSLGVILAATLAAVVAATLAAVWITRRISGSIGTAMTAAERVAEGDLTAHIEATSRDEAGQLLDAIARMNDGLRNVVSQVRVSADAVVTAAGQVAAGTTDLSQRTEEQASSLEETAASMEELAGTVSQNADNARQADELAKSVSRRAEQGGAEVGRAVVSMSEVSQSAARIADIIGVIDGISFQTNILALNAAVEAARAGEQGRGFAVVAAEVRSLAQRSAQAAKEIKDLINASVAKAQDGTRQVEQAGATIQTLVTDVKRVSDFMASIAEASSEQSRGVQQVNKTVTEMDRVVQQNATAVQEAAAAAEAMRGHAQALFDAVARFRLDQSGHSAQAPRAPAREAPVLQVVKGRSVVPAGKKTAVGGREEWEEF